MILLSSIFLSSCAETYRTTNNHRKIIELDVQAVFQAAYEPACYDRMLPYDELTEPALTQLDEQWVRDRLMSDAKRTVD